MRLNQLNMRRNEPDEWVLERPVVLPQAIRLVQESAGLAELADRLTIHETHLRQLLNPLLGGE